MDFKSMTKTTKHLLESTNSNHKTHKINFDDLAFAKFDYNQLKFMQTVNNSIRHIQKDPSNENFQICVDKCERISPYAE